MVHETQADEIVGIGAVWRTWIAVYIEHHLAAFWRGKIHSMAGFDEHKEGAGHLFSEETDREAFELRGVGDDGKNAARCVLLAQAGFDFQIGYRHDDPFGWV
ncbi:hypothetical protein D3C80_1566710 [compost metagenome]